MSHQEKERLMKLKSCPWCGWRSMTLWKFFDGVVEPHQKKSIKYSIHCNHCGFASKKSRLKWRTRWYWNHGNQQLRLKKKGGIIFMETNSDIKLAVDFVNHPPHYQTSGGLETIDVVEAFTEGLTGAEATNTGNVIKYICRWKNKNGLEDLKKCLWYLDRLIATVERKSNHEEGLK